MRDTITLSLKALSAVALLTVPALAAAATGQGFDVEAATRAYVDTLQGAELEKSNRYFEGGYWLILWAAVVGVLVDVVILQSRLSARFRDWAGRITKRTWLQPALYALPYTLAGTLLFLPWTIYAQYFREKQYDLMSQNFGAWIGDQAIGFLISLIVLPLLIMAIYAVIRRAPRTWWLWGTGVVALFLTICMLIAPVFISPLFNEYEEMEAGPLRDKIVAMAQEHDVPAEHIYVFNQSKQHKRISANVSGLGPTIRISLNDNLLERTAPEEVVAVMGHELGHYVMQHIWRSVAILLAIMAFGLFLVARIAPRLIENYGDRWGVSSISDPAAVPVLSLLLTLFFFLATPAQNILTRVNESEADAFGLDAAKEPDGFAKVSMRLSEYRKIEPGPWEEFFFHHHPSGTTRVRMAMQWKADHVENPVMVKPEPIKEE